MGAMKKEKPTKARRARSDAPYLLTATELIPAGEQLLDPKGVGKRMKLSPRTVSEMALEGRLPFFRIGIYQRFKWTEVEKYLEASCRCGPTVATPLAVGPKGNSESLKVRAGLATN